jgi:DNA invertase Pin-like site-specific DNA recombinase
MAKGNELRPRNGHTVIGVIVARISGCAGQKEVSLDDQIDHGKEEIGALNKGPTEFRIVATKGKGEWLDRPELAEIEALIRTREVDVLFVEDLGRLVRGTEAARMVGIAVDHGTRFISAHDCIDTNDESWEEDIISACRDHAGHQSHTSKRLKKKLMKRFVRSGGATAREIYGYIKPVGSKSYDDWLKNPEAHPVYREWLRILKETLNCSAVADFLNKQKVPTGPWSRRKNRWDGKMVRRITRNPILKGMPGRGFRHTVKYHEKGHRISQKNPEGPVFYAAPHLAFWEADEFDGINADLDRKNFGTGRKPANGQDPRLNVPRKRTRFPGQYSICWYCGYEHVWGANGVTDSLMCKHSREYGCWNSIGFNGPLAAANIAEAVAARLLALDGIDDQLRAIAEEAMEAGSNLAHEWGELRRDEATLSTQQANLAAAAAKFGAEDIFADKVNELKDLQRHLAIRRRSLERRTGRPITLPGVAELRELFQEKSHGLAVGSPEFGDFLRSVVPTVHVYLVRLLDGGHLMSRARVEIDVSGMVLDAVDCPAYREALKTVVTIDLFEPPQRERIREEAVRLAAEGLEQRDIARRLKVTQTAVYRALALDRMMRKRGLDSPYVVVLDPPNDYAKLRRHKNSRYKFTPRDGYQRPPI